MDITGLNLLALVSRGIMDQAEVKDVMVLLQNHGGEMGIGCVQIQVAKI